MKKKVHYVLAFASPDRGIWPNGRDQCIFCGKGYDDGTVEEDEFHRVFNAKTNWEFSRKYKTPFCRDNNEIMALWVMTE